jgi:hypothetical protein
MSRIPPPQHDPRIWQQTDEWIAEVVRENDELKKELARVDESNCPRLPVTTASTVAPNSNVPHSPVPWAVSGIWAFTNNDDVLPVCKAAYGSDAPDFATAKANAKFIVRACNNHYDLLNMLRTYRAMCRQCGELRCETCRKADAWIAKAEGR